VGADKPAPAHLNYIKNSIGIDASHWWVVGDDLLKDKGFAEISDGGIFIHISAEGKSSMDFRKLANILETLCQ
jgi:FMN phosphatase YigB (HAD superfamily)